MKDNSSQILTGGNMNSPILNNNLVYKEATVATETIHQLLLHVRVQGINWVPDSFGVDSNGKHVLSYIEGTVPHDTPDWLWDDSILIDIASKLRQWHDATANFNYQPTQWLLQNDEAREVICHNDFAPYNCVFKEGKFVGLIDFDLCSPGSRIWDIAYTVYRYIPLFPTCKIELYNEISPFTKEVMLSRLSKFLKEYSRNDKDYWYDNQNVLKKCEKRLIALANWSEAYGLQTKNQAILDNAKMYNFHASWVSNL